MPQNIETTVLQLWKCIRITRASYRRMRRGEMGEVDWWNCNDSVFFASPFGSIIILLSMLPPVLFLTLACLPAHHLLTPLSSTPAHCSSKKSTHRSSRLRHPPQLLAPTSYAQSVWWIIHGTHLPRGPLLVLASARMASSSASS